jgi:hypothetical protein
MYGDDCKTRMEPPMMHVNEMGRAVDEMPMPSTARPGFHQEVVISKVANGFVIRIGCKTFVAKSWAEVAGGLGEYWENPTQAEKKYSTL